jgi:hypothetical protein
MFVDDCETVCGGHNRRIMQCLWFHTTNHLGHSQVLGPEHLQTIEKNGRGERI